MQDTIDNIMEMLHTNYASFSKTQRRIADYLIEHPDTSCFLTLKQFAEATNTSEATILSFSRKVGCESFADMRCKMQQYISQWISPNERIKSSILQEEACDFLTSRVIDAENDALKQSLSYLSATDLQHAMDLLHGAKQIYLLAADYAGTVSYVFASRFCRIGLKVVDLGEMSVANGIYRLSQVTSDDLLVLFSFTPYTQIYIALAQFLHDHWGVKTLCFTDSLSAPGAKISDAVLNCVTKSPVFMNSVTAPISLINLLATSYVKTYAKEYSLYSEKVAQLQKLVNETIPNAEFLLI